MAKQRSPEEDLPADNAARIAIYDAFAAPGTDTKRTILSEDELLDRVIGRLRILVPRELHLAGELPYLHEKVQACIEAGVIERVGSPPGVLRLTGVPPRIRFPDGRIRDYEAGLEAARERLERDDAKLRAANFDVHKFVPSMPKRSADFKALVESMREHGYLPQFPVANGLDGSVIDGRARVAAAKLAGVDVLSTEIPTRRDTPLHRTLLVLDTNRARISDAQRTDVHHAIARIADRDWGVIVDDLVRTREWRLPVRRKKKRYRMEVAKVRYRPDQEPKVHITVDGDKVMIRSLVEAAGLAGYKINKLRRYAPMEEAKSNLSTSSKALFVRVSDAIEGITVMQREDPVARRKVEPEWEEIRQWLIANSGGDRVHADGTAETSAEKPESTNAAQPRLEIA